MIFNLSSPVAIQTQNILNLLGTPPETILNISNSLHIPFLRTKPIIPTYPSTHFDLQQRQGCVERSRGRGTCWRQRSGSRRRISTSWEWDLSLSERTRQQDSGGAVFLSCKGELWLFFSAENEWKLDDLVAGLIWMGIVVLEAMVISREEGGDGVMMVNQIWRRMEMVVASCDTVFVHVNEGTMVIWDNGSVCASCSPRGGVLALRYVVWWCGLLFDGGGGAWRGCKKEEEGAYKNDVIFNLKKSM